MAKKKQVRVKKSEPPESTEIMAEAIVKISRGFQRLMDGGLTEEAIVVLIQHKT